MATELAPWIMLSEGNTYNFVDPTYNKITIHEIAHSLANLCRFNGHSRRYLSVAEHSVYVSQIVPPEWALEGLLHDAAEALVGDVPSPLKMLLPEFKAIEDRAHAFIASRFDLRPEARPYVKQADLTMLATEIRALLPADAHYWVDGQGIKSADIRLNCLEAGMAKRMFMSRYHEITASQQWGNHGGARIG